MTSKLKKNKLTLLSFYHANMLKSFNFVWKVAITCFLHQIISG